MIDERAEAECVGRQICEVAEIREAVFGPDRPIAGDGIFDAAADGPAGSGVRDIRGRIRDANEEAGRIGMLVVEAAESDAAGRIK
jgi:hypothetical protein